MIFFLAESVEDKQLDYSQSTGDGWGITPSSWETTIAVAGRAPSWSLQKVS